MKAIAVAIGLGLLLACAPVAGASTYKGYWFRLSHFKMDATATAEGTETDPSGTTTTANLKRTATIDYRGRRGDLATFNDSRGYPGDISGGHTIPVTVRASGSWSMTDDEGTRSGTCTGSKTSRPFEPYSQIHRSGSNLRGEFMVTAADESFDENCPLYPDLGGARFPWKLPASAFRKRTVKIPLRYDDEQGEGIRYAVHWSGTVTLKRIKVCHSSRCAASVR